LLTLISKQFLGKIISFVKINILLFFYSTHSYCIHNLSSNDHLQICCKYIPIRWVIALSVTSFFSIKKNIPSRKINQISVLINSIAILQSINYTGFFLKSSWIKTLNISTIAKVIPFTIVQKVVVRVFGFLLKVWV